MSLTDVRGKSQAQAGFVELLRAIATASNEAAGIEEAMQTCLDRVCALTKWPVGHFYVLATDAPNELAPTASWHLDNPELFETFRAVTEATRMPWGIGLPGRVLESGKPAWITDVMRDPNFPRAKMATDLGIRAGFAFPVLVGAEVVGVLEFFSSRATEPDEMERSAVLLKVMADIGTQLGRVVERKRAEEEIKRLNADLERRVIERTAQLEAANRELQKEIAERKRLEQQKDEFIALASHELNTPLAAIKGYAQINLRIAADSGDEMEHSAILARTLRIINEKTNLLAHLVSEMLDVSRMQSGRLDLDCEPFDLRQLVSEVAGSLALTAPDFSFEVGVPEQPVMIEADRQRIEQVLTNLVQNTVKYSGDSRRVEISLTVEAGEAVTAVRDRGVGIPAGQQSQIFERFFRASNVPPVHYGGLGLGLYISHNIVARHGGRMWVESVEGEGSTFYFALPLL